MPEFGCPSESFWRWYGGFTYSFDPQNELIEKERRTDMNINPNLVSMIAITFLIGTACSPTLDSSPVMNQTQPEERDYKIAPLVPVTGHQENKISENAYDYEQETQSYPSQQLHRNCVSNNSQRQDRCQEKEPNDVIIHPGKTNSDLPTYPSQKSHSDCVSEDIQQQYKCVD
jgi:hypothetical protein